MANFTIYMHTCRSNGKSYIGITSRSMDHRWKGHIRRAKKGSEYVFHCAIRKYGYDVWDHKVLETAFDLESAKNAERRLILEHKTCILDENSDGYNMTRGGDTTYEYLPRGENHHMF